MEDINASVRAAFNKLLTKSSEPHVLSFDDARRIGVSLEQKKYFAVNGSALCVALNNSNECKEGDLVLSVGYQHILFKIRHSCMNEYAN